MATPQSTLTSILKTNGHSVTKARLAVFEALLGQEPMAMQTLIKSLPSIDRASVYRAIELYEKLGVVQHITTGWKYNIELSDHFMGHHHHLTCVQCGKTTAIDESALEDALAKLAASHQFKTTAHQIELQGYCKECASPKQSRDPRR